MTEPTLELLDSRRITGVHWVLPGPGALIDVSMPEEQLSRFIETWREAARELLLGIDWDRSEIAVRDFPGVTAGTRGASLGFTAPIDALYAATEVNESAWNTARAWVESRSRPGEAEFSIELARLESLIRGESNPALIELQAEARRRGVPFVSDDDIVSVGLGVTSRQFEVRAIPPLSEIPWDEIQSIPVLAITGTNGKTTTTRLLSAIATAAGFTPGFCSTDGVRVADETVDVGDYAGPGGARLVVRDRRVDFAILEMARGGLLRRGTGVDRATAVAVTNVGADHLGEFGVHDVDAIADTKLTIAGIAHGHGAVVLNADDDRLRAWGERGPERVTWFSLDDAHPTVRAHIDAGRSACTLRDGEVVFWSNGEATPIIAAANIPISFGGAARYNIANALCATALARLAGVEADKIAEGLRAFDSTPENSPGRGNWFDHDGVRIFADFAHNPHGFEAMVDMASRMARQRLGIVIGQAGDRDDESIRALVRIAWTLEPDLIVIKEMEEHWRGREPGEVRALFDDELQRLEVPTERIAHAPSELDGVKRLVEWSQAGDLLLLPLHAERDASLAYLAAL